jgi:kynureninase
VALRGRGFVPDYREPDLLRIAPSPLYSRFAECEHLVAEIGQILADGTDLASLSGSLVS